MKDSTNKVLAVVTGLAVIAYLVFGGQMIVIGISILLWALLFANMFGVFYIWIALAGAMIMAAASGNQALALAVVGISLAILIFDLAAFSRWFARNRQALHLFGKVHEKVTKEIMSELKQQEFFYVVGRRLGVVHKSK